MSIPLVVSPLVATWRSVTAGNRFCSPLWTVLGLLCLAGVMRRGPAVLAGISRQEVDVELEVLWERAVRHRAVQPAPHHPPVQ